MAKILLHSYSGYGAWFVLRMIEEGHDVDYYLQGKDGKDVLAGIIPESLEFKPKFNKYDLVLFDLTGKPKTAEDAALVTHVIGDGNLQSQLEDDRLFGIEVMEEVGINVPPYETFNDIQEAKKYIRETNRTYVFKPFGGQDQDTETTYVGKSPDDLIEYLDKLGSMSGGVEFLLQQVVHGTELSTEAYFNGEDFFLINATLEEKKFMEGNKGPNTGCAGNLVWTYDKEPAIFRQGIGLMKDWLQQVKFKGMLDLNTIVSDSKLYGLEWTPRFGYDASATLFSLFGSSVGDFLCEIACGGRPDINLTTSFAAGTRLSIPPYPTEVKGYHKDGVPIKGIDIDEAWSNTFLYDAKLDENECLVTAGVNGYIAVPFGRGASIDEAWYGVKERIKNIQIPDMQYRSDLHKTTKQRYETLQLQGWLR